MRRFFSLAVLAATSIGLAGCVAYPAGPGYGGYYAAPGYYGAPGYYAAPSVALNYSSGGGYYHDGYRRYRRW